MSGVFIVEAKFYPLVRYGLAVVFVLLALLVTLSLHYYFLDRLWFLFFAAVMASAWYGGKGPGWLAVILSSVAVEYFFIPPVRTWILKPVDVPFFLTFAACAIFASWLSSRRRQAEDSLKHARDALEAKVEERTAELKRRNEELLLQIAERKHAEGSLLATQAELARVARVAIIGELTASIAHEVNQPLAGIVANADACLAWLSKPQPNLDEAKKAASSMILAATRASEVIARIRSLITKAAPERLKLNINEVIEEAVALARTETMNNNVSVVTELASDLPIVLGDRIQLQQVILNLAMNGIAAMSSMNDRPRRLLIRSQTQDADRVLVAVQDSGTGMTPDVVARLFEPFFTTKSQGIGMGLPISRSIIEGHGGRLWAESTVSQGSTFQFTLPTEACDVA
jgi:C4-dicarboxylate-specific signal transduction histidine kinase